MCSVHTDELKLTRLKVNPNVHLTQKVENRVRCSSTKETIAGLNGPKPTKSPLSLHQSVMGLIPTLEVYLGQAFRASSLQIRTIHPMSHIFPQTEAWGTPHLGAPHNLGPSQLISSTQNHFVSLLEGYEVKNKKPAQRYSSRNTSHRLTKALSSMPIKAKQTNKQKDPPRCPLVLLKEKARFYKFYKWANTCEIENLPQYHEPGMYLLPNGYHSQISAAPRLTTDRARALPPFLKHLHFHSNLTTRVHWRMYTSLPSELNSRNMPLKHLQSPQLKCSSGGRDGSEG